MDHKAEIEKRKSREITGTRKKSEDIQRMVMKATAPSCCSRTLRTEGSGSPEYAVEKLGVKCLELKWGQGAKNIGGEVKLKDPRQGA